MKRTLQKYGSYEKFEQAAGGSLLTKSRIWNHVRKYMVKEGCLGEELITFGVLTTTASLGATVMDVENMG